MFYFYSKSKRKESMASGESEEDEPALLRAISFDKEFDNAEQKDGENSEANYENSGKNGNTHEFILKSVLTN